MITIIDETLVDDYYKKFHYAARYMKEEGEEIIIVKMKKGEVKNMARMLKMLKAYMQEDKK